MRSKLSKVTIEELQNIINISNSLAQVLFYFGLKSAGGNYLTIKKIISDNKLDLSKLKENAKKENAERCKLNIIRKEHDLNDILNNKVYYNSTSRLKIRLINNGILKDECNRCKISIWQGQKLSLHLHHKDGNRVNNSLENLELLCPNCHSLTDTYTGRNQRRKNKTANEKQTSIKVIHRCQQCNKELKHKNKHMMCKDCYNIFQRKKERPSLEELLKDINELGYCGTGRKYGVSDNTIRKWIKAFLKVS